MGAVSLILLCCGDTSPQESFIRSFSPMIMALLTSYLVNKDVVEVIGEAACKFVSQVRKQVLLLLHSC